MERKRHRWPKPLMTNNIYCGRCEHCGPAKRVTTFASSADVFSVRVPWLSMFYPMSRVTPYSPTAYLLQSSGATRPSLILANQLDQAVP
jgi:hypothetical protein